MSAHTPGPWSLGSSDYPVTDLAVCSKAQAGEVGATIARLVAKNGREYQNARLIASAPELLDALTEIISQIDQGGSDGKVFARDYCVTQARAAIAKATGANNNLVARQ